MHVGTTRKPGALVAELAHNGQLTRLLEDWVGDDRAARALLTQPPLAIVASVAAMFLLPAVFLFTCPGSIASEVSTRSIRYLACRTDRLAIGLGKLVGQLAVGGVAALMGVALTLVLGEVWMIEVPLVASLLTLVRYAASALAFAMPYAALGIACSALVSNANGARAVAFAITIASFVLHSYLASEWLGDAPNVVAEVVRLFLPHDAFFAYWSPDPLVRASAFGRGIILAILFHAIAQARLDRRDV